MNRNLVVYLSLCLFIMASCHASKYPIDEKPSVKIDARLLGKWKVKEKNNNEIYSVSKKNDYQYSIGVKLGQHGKTDYFPAFFSKIDDVLFLNIAQMGDSNDSIGGYGFLRVFKINDAGNTITAAFVADSTIETMNSSKEVRARISNNLNNPFFYADTAVLYKVK